MALPYNPYFDYARMMSVTNPQQPFMASASDIAPGQAFQTQAGGGSYSSMNQIPYTPSAPTNPNLLRSIPSISSMKMPAVAYNQIPDWTPVGGWDATREISNEQLPVSTPQQAPASTPQQTVQNTVPKVQGGGFKVGNDAYDTYRIKKSGDLSRFSQGQKADMAMAGAMGAINLGVDLATIGSQKLNIGKPSTMYYAEGVKPTYQTGEYYNRAYNARPQGATGMEVASTGLKAAGAGAQIGSMMGPAGTLIGAGVGALVGGIGAGITGGIRKRKQRREKQEALDLATAQQSDYNKRALDFSQQQTAQSEYARRTNPYARISNYYTA